MFKKILVPLDGSEMAAKVLPRVAALAKTMQARVTLLHVRYREVGEMMGESSPGTMEAAAAQEAKFCERFLAQAGQDLKAQDLNVDWVCLEGVPSMEIIGYAQDHDYDLIALGTHGKGEIAWYLGGVAKKVAAHATVPVLLFRTFATRPPVLKQKLQKLAKDAEMYLAWSLPG